MNIIHKIPAALLAALSLLSVSCSDWLDVKPLSEEREKDLFTSYAGYREALAGCYSTMASENLYGRRLTMADIENLACLWMEPDNTSMAEQYYLWHHNYANSYGEATMKAIYGGLYNVVVQANKIIEHVNADGTVIADPAARNIIAGEAYALRAFCHFDVLRLFGQLPQKATVKVSLPYALKASITEQAPYLDYDAFVARLQQDLDRAEELLGQSDPVLRYSLESLNLTGDGAVALDDNFQNYRQFRLNYYAVKALKARFYLYTGQNDKAYAEARAVIDARVDGKPFVQLSGVTDLQAGYCALPGECVFALSNRSLPDYAFSLLGGENTTSLSTSYMLVVTTDMLDKQLYAGKNTASDNRYLTVWNHLSADPYGTKYPTLKKYYYNTSEYTDSRNLSTLLTKIQVMPLMRLSELYLIAMETAPGLDEANSLYKTYMASHNVNVTEPLASMEAVKQEVVGEYRREFYGEGVMFYTYKRLGMENLMFYPQKMGEAQYVLPLPTSEFDPSQQ